MSPELNEISFKINQMIYGNMSDSGLRVLFGATRRELTERHTDHLLETSSSSCSSEDVEKENSPKVREMQTQTTEEDTSTEKLPPFPSATSAPPATKSSPTFPNFVENLLDVPSTSIQAADKSALRNPPPFDETPESGNNWRELAHNLAFSIYARQDAPVSNIPDYSKYANYIPMGEESLFSGSPKSVMAPLNIAIPGHSLSPGSSTENEKDSDGDSEANKSLLVIAPNESIEATPPALDEILSEDTDDEEYHFDMGTRRDSDGSREHSVKDFRLINYNSSEDILTSESEEEVPAARRSLIPVIITPTASTKRRLSQQIPPEKVPVEPEAVYVPADGSKVVEDSENENGKPTKNPPKYPEHMKKVFAESLNYYL